MKKVVFKKLTVALTVITTLLVGCQDESLKPAGNESGAICTTCPESPEPEDPEPGPPTPIPPRCVSRPDLIVTAIVKGSGCSPTEGYTVTIKNIGTATAHIDRPDNRFFFQAWYSINGFVRSEGAGGSVFGPAVPPNQTATASLCTDPNSIDYRFLIIETFALNPGLLNECSTGNNNMVVRIPLL